MSASADLHDVWEIQLPLGIACNHCLHRSLVEQHRLGAHETNLRTLDTFSFRCSKCGRRQYTAHVFKERRQVRRFMAEYR